MDPIRDTRHTTSASTGPSQTKVRADFVLDPDGDILLVLNNPDAQYLPHRYLHFYVHEADWEPAPERKPMSFLVSSKHLTLASEYFRTALNGAWSDTTVTDGPRRLEATDWDHKALLVVLRIIHGRGFRLSRSPDFDIIGEIALIADYYKCVEPIYPLAHRWLAQKNYGIPRPDEAFGRGDVLAVFITTVFFIEGGQSKLGDESFGFWEATALCLRKARGRIQADDIPLAENVIDAIEARRRTLITGVFVFLDKVFRDACDMVIGCSNRCRWEIRQAIASCADMQDVNQISPTKPWDKYTYDEARGIVSSIFLQLSDHWSRRVWTGQTPCTCSLNAIVNPRWRTEGPIGLILHDYQPKVRDTVPSETSDWTSECTKVLYDRLVARGLEKIRGFEGRDPGM